MPQFLVRVRFAILGMHSIPSTEQFLDALRRKMATGVRFPIFRLEVHAEPRDPTEARPAYLANDTVVDTTLWATKSR